MEKNFVSITARLPNHKLSLMKQFVFVEHLYVNRSI